MANAFYFIRMWYAKLKETGLVHFVTRNIARLLCLSGFNVKVLKIN